MELVINLETIRFYLITLAALALLISVIFPLVFSIRPYRKNIGNPSWALKSRLWSKTFFFFLAAYNSMLLFLKLYTDFSIAGSSLVALSLRNLSLPIYAGLLIFIIYTWIKHPDGIRGL